MKNVIAAIAFFGMLGSAHAEISSDLHLAALCDSTQDFNDLSPVKGGYIGSVKLYQKYFKAEDSGVLIDWISAVEDAHGDILDGWETALAPGKVDGVLFDQITLRSAANPGKMGILLVESKKVTSDFDVLLTLADPTATRSLQGNFGSVMTVATLKCHPVSKN